MLVTGYRGGVFDEEIVYLANTCSSLDEAWVHRPLSVDDIRSLWFESTWYNPRDFALLVIDGRVRGYGWAWSSRGVGRVFICVDPMLTSSLYHAVVEELLSWARLRLEEEKISVVRLRALFEHGVLHRFLKSIISNYVEDYPATVMVLEKPPRLVIPRGYSIREGGLDDIDGIVRVYNEAFSRYEWFIEWSMEDARKWYSRRKVIVFVAEHKGEGIVGYVDGEVMKSIDGSVNAVIATLAVKPKHQGKGLGKALLSLIASKLWSMGVNRIFLESVEGLEPFYGKLGFRVWRRYVSLVTYIGNLPSKNVTLVKHG